MSNERMNNSRNGDGEGAAGGTPLPRELRGVGRLLDEQGTRARGRLRGESLDRIIAASEFQLPLALGDVRPVVGRIGPVRRASRAPLLRLAAATAALVGLGAAIVVAYSVRSGARDTTDVLAGAGNNGEMKAVNTPVDAPLDTPLDMGLDMGLVVADGSRGSDRLMHSERFAHFDSVLQDELRDVGSQRAAEGAIAALAEGGTGAIALAGIVGGEDAFASELSSLFEPGVTLNAGRMSYDDLSDELAFLATRTAGGR